MQAGEQRRSPFLTHPGALRRQAAADVAFDRIERGDALQRLGGDRRVIYHVEVVEFTSRVRPARRFHDLPVGVELGEAAIGVGLQNAGVAAQVRSRMFALAIRRVPIPHRRWIATAGRTIIAYVGPQASGLGLAASGIEHRHRRVIGVDLLRRVHITTECVNQRIEQARCAADPRRERGAIELDPGAPVDARLSIQRAMVGVLGDDDLCEQPRRGHHPIERPRRRRLLDHPSTVTAGEFRPYMPDHLEVARHQVEHFGNVLAEPTHRVATLRTVAARRRMDDSLARQVRWKRTRCAAKWQHAPLRRRLRRILRRQ